MNTNLIIAFINQELGINLHPEDEEYLDNVWKDMRGSYTSKLFVYVDGEEGDRQILEFRQLVNRNEYQLGAYINEGGDNDYYIFTDFFIAQCNVIIGSWMEEKIKKIYNKRKFTDFELDQTISNMTLKLK